MTSPLSKTYLIRKEVAAALGIGYSSVPRILEKFGIKRDRKYHIKDVLKIKNQLT